MAIDLDRDPLAEIPVRIITYVAKSLRAGFDEEEAFERLLGETAKNNRSVHDLAEVAIKTYKRPRDFALGHLTVHVASDIYMRLKVNHGASMRDWSWNGANARFTTRKFEAEFRRRMERPRGG